MNWDQLVERLRERELVPPGNFAVSPLSGGDINRAYRLEFGSRRLFVKLNRAELLPMFEAELTGLQAIRDSGTIRVPEPMLTGSIDTEAFIIMSHIDLGGRPDPARFASVLAAMHHCVGKRFGFAGDNTIGSTPQPNSWSDDWVEFWRRQRLGHQLQLGAQKGFTPDLLDAGARLGEGLQCFFIDYQPQPSLLHGDLWSGNWSADESGNPVIFDPACYYGDHEADLAMMELFGHPGEDFFAAYRESFPIDPGYGLRRELYNLYHILNHANLFGGGYAGQALRMTRGLLAQI